MKLGGVGVWSPEIRSGAPGPAAEAAAELEDLGYTALWLPHLGPDVFEAMRRTLDATRAIVVASGVLSVYQTPADELAAWRANLPVRDQQRLLLGLGVSHRQVIGAEWIKPLAAMSSYLDALDGAGVDAGARCIAAQGPRMMELARERSAGAHPYLVMPEHTQRAREILGPGALLAPEQGVVFETDPDRARAIARDGLSIYWRLTNYTDNWKRFGFTDTDIEQRSDRLVDALVAWGDVGDIAARVAAHREAGADHVCVKVIQPPGSAMPLHIWRQLAQAIV